jgi:hypothetical protein
LAYPSISAWEGDPAWQKIVEQKDAYDSFSMCLVEENGVMSMGMDFSGTSDIKWTAITLKEYYSGK